MNRQHFIGASDISAILGISPWKTPLQLYLEKTGQAEPEKEKPVLRRGQRWEPIALQMLMDLIEDDEGSRPTLWARNERFIDKSHDFFSCEIDAEIDYHGERTNVEI